MLRRAAFGAVGGMLHLVADALLGALVLLLLGAVVLAWRLGQGPLDVTWAASRLERVISQPDAQVRVRSASLSWAGFHDGADGPLDIRLTGVRDLSPGGTLLADAPRAAVVLPLWPLLLGRLEPRAIVVEDPRLVVMRLPDGSFQLGTTPPAPGPAPPTPEPHAAPTPPADAPPGLARLLDELRSATLSHGTGALSRLRHVRVTGLAVLVHDQPLGLDWQAGGDIELRRFSGGGILGDAGLHVALGRSTVRLQAKADVKPEGTGTDLTLSVSPFDPADIARDATGPGVSRLAMLGSLDAPVSLALTASLGPRLQPLDGQVELAVGAGTAHLGDGTVTLAAATLQASATPQRLVVQDLSVAFAPLPGGQPPPHLTGHAEAQRGPDGAAGKVVLDIDQVALPDLARYWPAGLGGGARAWITANIVAGVAHALHVELGLAAPPDLSHATLTSLAGGFGAENVTGYWLRPVPPIENARLRLDLQGPDVVVVTVLAGHQGGLAVDGGVVRIAGLSHQDQTAAITVPVVGPFADLMQLLANKRLNLLSHSKLGFTNPSGRIDGVLHLTLPLDTKVTTDELRIDAEAQLTALHLGAVVAGHDLDAGAFDARVDGDGLKLTGNAHLGGLPAALEFETDFRAGPPTQIVQQARIGATPTAAQLAVFGIDAAGRLAGTTVLDVTYAEQRGGRADIVVNADLKPAALHLPLGWSKQAGVAANAHARIVLDHGRLTALDDAAANGPGLLLRSHAEFAAGQQTLHLDRVVLGETRASGTLSIPAAAASPIALRLAGPVLDLSSQFDAGKTAAETAAAPTRKPAAPKPPQRGRPWRLDARFDRVLLAERAPLAPLDAHAENDGLRLTAVDVKLGAAPAYTVTATISRAGAVRTLALNAADAGTLLRGLGVADNIRGGTLALNGRFDDTQPDSPLDATANLFEFRVTDAPAVARLLKAATLFGVVDILRGPGVSFSRMILPFRYVGTQLNIHEARAYSPTLGVTATGNLDFGDRTADLHGTVVPAYLLNTALGRLPLVGKLFSPETGGGLFAVDFSVAGSLSDPAVKVNPLSALAPGFLRRLFRRAG